MSADQNQLQEFVAAAAQGLDVPGVAVGVLLDGVEHYAFHGVTSIENPLPVDAGTLFQFGSTGKTYTATLMMRLVDQGLVDLDAPVRQYLPEFKLKDEDVAAKVTVLQLFNHTAGWQGDMMDNTGDGDDALAKYVELMSKLEQTSPLGSVVSYNNASLSVAGRIIERITGKTYEQAMKEMIFTPLGMDMSFFFPNEIMTRRFAAGHAQKPDGTVHVTRPWAMARGNSPAGGMSCNSADLITWARFHMGDGRAKDGTQVLSREWLKTMQEPTFDMRGSALGDYVGISWLMRDVDGVRLVGHGGDTIGHHSDFVMVPERNFAISSLTNCGPNGNEFNSQVVKWALEAYLGVIEKDPEAVKLSDAELAPYTGTFETIAVWADITASEGDLIVNVRVKPETLKQMIADGEEPPEPEPIPLGILPGEGDRYIVVDGPAKGMKGYFMRNAAGEIEAVHVGGRLATRSATGAG
jgi:CubicO group peptidase (beta-lactamase class C family)